MEHKKVDHATKIAVVGLGYVGLPIALEFAKKYDVVGFDINQERVEMMRQGKDPSKELSASDFQDVKIHFTHEIEELRDANFYVVAVPTPIDEHKNPNLTPLLSACSMLGSVISKGDIIVFESTVYPGCTEEDCVPILEKGSGLKMGDFKIGYSPERINPGDREHTLTKIKKVISGSDQPTLDKIAEVYGSIIEAGVYAASSIKVAEAAKIIENTQRDVNIALMNELSLIFDKMGINTFEVLEAAGTKWNFLKFFPGLVGGHCIGVDPYYLTYKSKEIGYHSKVILSGRQINDDMPKNMATGIIKHLIQLDKPLKQAKVLIFGVTFKENVSDIRNSKVADLVDELHSYNLIVHVTDPYADHQEVKHAYHFDMVNQLDAPYDIIILAVNHKEYLQHNEAYFKNLATEQTLFYDVKGVFRGKIKDLTYKSL